MSMKNTLYTKVISNSLYILLGVFMAFFTTMFEFILVYFIGGFLLISGIIEVIMFFIKRQEIVTIGYELIIGGIKAIIGTFCIVMTNDAIEIVSIIFGLYLIVISFLPLLFNIMVSSNGGKIDLWNLGLHIFTMLTGICLLFYNETMTTLLSICGILIVARGIFGIVVSVINYNRKKKVMAIMKKEFDKMIQENKIIDCQAEEDKSE